MRLQPSGRFITTRGTRSVARHLFGAGILFHLAFALHSARASDFEAYDFSLRFPAAISRFASYGDVAATGNAQAASEWSSSANPASAAWPHAGRKFRHAFSPQYGLLRFDNDTELEVWSEALTRDAGANGVFIPAAAQISTNHKTDRNGLGFRFDADFFQLQWGKLICPATAVGINVTITDSQTTFDVANRTVATTSGKSYNVRLGAVHQLVPHLRAGATLDYTRSPGTTDFSVFDPISLRSVIVPVRDTTDQWLVRAGLAWEYSEGSTFAVDYHGGTFTNDTGRLHVHRFPIGVEQLVIKDILFARAGLTFATRGGSALTAGLGISLGQRASVDLAYQRDMFPEIKPEFGQAKTFTASIALAF